MEVKHMSLAKPVDFTELVRGGVYRDAYGKYVIVTDELSVVDLQTGYLQSIAIYYSSEDHFVPVEATLEIR